MQFRILVAACCVAWVLPASVLGQKPNIPGYYIGGYSGGNNRGGYAGYYIGGHPNMNGRGDAGGYYIGGYPAVNADAIPSSGYPSSSRYQGYSTRWFPGYPERYHAVPPTPGVAFIDVQLPADAELWFDDKKMAQTGSYRMFTTPELQPGKIFGYKVRARWFVRGHPVDDTREILMRPGERRTVRFTD